MTYGIVESESLANPLVLNKYKTRKIFIDHFPLNKPKDQYCHVYVLELSLDQLRDSLREISKFIKPEWFSFFWNKERAYVVMQNKVFKLEREKNWQSKPYEKMRDYAQAHGLQRVYVDLNISLPYYEGLLTGRPEKPKEWRQK